jgi:hypothetical protein
MATRNVPQTEWRPFFDVLSKTLAGNRVEVEAASLDLGDQVVADWLPLVGITYDSHNDLLDISMQGAEHFSHLIRHPRTVAVQQEDGGVKSIAVTTDDGVEEILTFKSALLLPATAGP